MTDTCWTCKHSALRDKGDDKRDKALRDMARHGLANCALSMCRAVFMPFDTPGCPKHEAMTAEAIGARDKWRAQNAT